MHFALRIRLLPISTVLRVLVDRFPTVGTVGDLSKITAGKPFDSLTRIVSGHTSILHDPIAR
jgi:hypothetical protein